MIDSTEEISLARKFVQSSGKRVLVRSAEPILIIYGYNVQSKVVNRLPQYSLFYPGNNGSINRHEYSPVDCAAIETLYKSRIAKGVKRLKKEIRRNFSETVDGNPNAWYKVYKLLRSGMKIGMLKRTRDGYSMKDSFRGQILDLPKINLNVKKNNPQSEPHVQDRNQTPWI